MIQPLDDNLTGTENICLESSDRQRHIDIHCHCLPAIDDGPASTDEALALCRALVDDGIGTVIATPHQLGRFNDSNHASQIRQAVCLLNEELRANNIPLTVFAGGDVRVDERICQLLQADEILTLADGGRSILLELPHEIFIDIEPLLIDLSHMGIQAVISHPERHPVLAEQPKILCKWMAQSAHLQITATSLLGEFGLAAQQAAWHFLSSGWASLVATDAHDLDVRRPQMKAAFECISIKLGQTIAHQLCIDNPLRVLRGQNLQMTHSFSIGKCNDKRVPASL